MKIRHVGWAIAMALLAGAPAWAADCPAPKAPGAVAQQQSLPDGTTIRSIAGPNLSPYLEILDAACHPAAALGSSGGGAPQDDPDDPSSLLRFKVLTLRGLPQPLIVTSIASRGASDTSFSTQLISVSQGRYRGLLPRPIASLLEGGVYIGPLGGRFGTGIAVWNFVWATTEAHVSPHRYTLQRLRWTGSGFTALPTLTTRGKYASAAPALAEFKVAYKDITRDFPDFDQFQ